MLLSNAYFKALKLLDILLLTLLPYKYKRL